MVYTLHRGGPKWSIIIASVLLLVGNWIRYGATRSGTHGSFGGLMFGQVLTGLAQPFVLAAPTRYSDLWFTNRGRVAATAVMSLANPLGGALAQLIGPAWVHKPSDIPNLVLYISIIVCTSSVVRMRLTCNSRQLLLHFPHFSLRRSLRHPALTLGPNQSFDSPRQSGHSACLRNFG